MGNDENFARRDLGLCRDTFYDGVHPDNMVKNGGRL